ncbi:substrate-binding periplasmic protein [Algicola sagamiensis]|uniref:substrate-binding periplasmic protein n=1 Tax=Algicola sagamiensis TaxID=163869 RepID=UPI0003731D33|nr:transporter substrate-binding domain-containing protein [Algicola sagamiensis]
MCLKQLLIILPLISFSLLSKEKYVIASGDWEPFTGKTLPQGGLVVQLARAALQAVGQDIKVIYMPWERSYQGVQKHKVLGTFPWVVTDERQQIFLVTKTLFHSEEQFFVRYDSDIQFKTEKDISGKVVCLPKGWTPSAIQGFLDKKLIQLYEPSASDLCFRAIFGKKADLFASIPIAGWSAISKLGFKSNDFRIEGPILSKNKLAILVSKEHPQSKSFVKAFNEGLDKIEQSGEYQRIYDSHISYIQRTQVNTN